MDETDLCCKLHTICLLNLSERNSSCDDEMRYRTIYSHDQIQCLDHDTSVMRQWCLCDRQAAQCLQQALSTFDPEKRMSSTSDICETKGEYFKYKSPNKKFNEIFQHEI